ncbi:Dynamin N domain containing protein [Trichuris trichiura]|uniref:Dynamin N domain containing protein n=1 Tax=Trichuris trichiura TaxID=36087 RepID=A0A077ZA22_TRITR|nr:Dynamin N domain containing protein [Trichuris trichiura]
MSKEPALSKTSTDKENTGNKVVVSFPIALHLHYINKVRPSEKLVPSSLLGHDPITDAEFGCPPCVLIAGEYSVGKTTMIQQFLKTDYAGSRIGEGPTTDAFFILLYGQEHKQVSAQYMMNDKRFPYQSLKYLGERTLRRCFAVYLPAHFLRYVTLIDSPGILPKSEEPARDFEFERALTYFALKADSILFLFDARRPLVSEEVTIILKKFYRFESKLLHIVNKVDSCNASELQLAFHKIASSLARISSSKTLPYLYAGSFWDQPMRHPVNYERLERDMCLLFRHLRYLTFKVHARRLDEVTCHAARIRAIALVAKESDHLKRHLSLKFFQKAYLKKQIDFVIYPMMLKRYSLNPADLPSTRSMAHSLWWSFKSGKLMFNLAALKKLEDFLQNDVRQFIQMLSYCMSVSQLVIEASNDTCSF